MWLHIATNRSKNLQPCHQHKSIQMVGRMKTRKQTYKVPPDSISICMVPLRLNVDLLRMIKAR